MTAKEKKKTAEPEEVRVQLTTRQAEVVELLVEGKSHKRIAGELGLAVGYVNRVVKEASRHMPGAGSPSFRIRRWYWNIAGGSTEAIDEAAPPP